MNQDGYKKVIEQIHAPEDLKQKTIQKMRKEQKSYKKYPKWIAACAMFVVVFTAGAIMLKEDNQNLNHGNSVQNTTIIAKVASTNEELPRFKDIGELKDILENDYSKSRATNGMKSSIDFAVTEDSMAVEESATVSVSSTQNYSKTNVQVENVDEADIVKTDGNYIYYVQNSRVYIVNANDLSIISELEFEKTHESFNPYEAYIYEDKLVVLGNSYEYEEEKNQTIIGEIFTDSVRISGNREMAKVIVLDISNKENPKQIRELSLEGYYVQSRMIGENVYFISNKYPNYYKGIRDDEILPVVKDSVQEKSTKTIDSTDIVYFKDTESHQFMMVAGFNVNNFEPMNIETFFGASNNVYVSEKNLYITQINYSDYYKMSSNTIYKFQLDNASVKLQCKGEVKGYLKNQFSMDEYEGNLRIATTSGYDEDSSNGIYIFDENLKEIGKVEDLAKGEKIYSVRLMGKVGYVVTFEQVDPLFVIDLSDPTNPQVKGELKIPGYSSYLHPYDETHVIGIGYNTKPNGYGGVTNANMKMSMFDVSNMENPVEMFHIDIGGEYASSEVINNHKALFYHKDKNLIGFPVTYRDYYAQNDKNGFVIFKMDLESGFEVYGEIVQKIDYRTNVDRVIYIGDNLYTLSNTQIIKYDLNTIEKVNEVELKDE